MLQRQLFMNMNKHHPSISSCCGPGFPVNLVILVLLITCFSIFSLDPPVEALALSFVCLIQVFSFEYWCPFVSCCSCSGLFYLNHPHLFLTSARMCGSIYCPVRPPFLTSPSSLCFSLHQSFCELLSVRNERLPCILSTIPEPWHFSILKYAKTFADFQACFGNTKVWIISLISPVFVGCPQQACIPCTLDPRLLSVSPGWRMWATFKRFCEKCIKKKV